MGTTTPGDSLARTTLVAAALLAIVAILFIPATGLAQSDEEATEQLVVGAQVYADNCSACHQPSGVGIPGAFPPLLDNPHVDDSEYVRGVIQNGRSGVIEVNGETYDGVMPSFASLDDTQIDAVIAFLQNDLTVPGATPPEAGGGTTAGTTLPPVASSMATLAFVVAAGIALWVLAPRIVGVVDRGEVSKLDAGLKSGLIVIYFIVATVFIPSMVIQSEVITRLPAGVQDFVATTLWVGGLGIGILGLWWFQRQDRI